MKELFKKLTALLCFVALLGLIAPPSTYGTENPWDADGNSTEGGSSSDDSESDDTSAGTSSDSTFTGSDVYVGFSGFMSFIADSFNFYLRSVLGDSKFGKNAGPRTVRGPTAENKS